ncbi:MAG: hypothetical protein JOZ19_16295 [Rubrobacter sp.]|nr:hypothetical protein [Rubrobacter sp.]
MIIRGIEEQDLRAALEVANYAYRGNLHFREGPEPLTLNRQSWRLHLGVEHLDGLGHRRQSRWVQKERVIRSACYHAYRDFLYAVFERAPRARVVTSLAVYEGPAHFEATHRRISRLNVGSFFEPVRMEDCCDCPKGLRNEETVPELYLGAEYTLEPDRKIYWGLNTDERKG